MRKLISKFVAATSSKYIGKKDEIFFGNDKRLKITDGITPGGTTLEVAIPVVNFAQPTEPVNPALGTRWYNTSTYESKVLVSQEPLLWEKEASPLYYTIEKDYVSIAVQNPTALDTPMTVSYGPGGTSANNLIYVSAVGIITCVESGPYMFKSRHRVGRIGASGISHIFQWIESSIDNGVTWIKIGNSVSVSLDNANDQTLFFDSTPLFMQAGQQLRSRIARSSIGNNSGGLIPEQPSAALIAEGVQPSPSAQLTVYRLENWLYN
jgi:hypothetical protein